MYCIRYCTNTYTYTLNDRAHQNIMTRVHYTLLCLSDVTWELHPRPSNICCSCHLGTSSRAIKCAVLVEVNNSILKVVYLYISAGTKNVFSPCANITPEIFLGFDTLTSQFVVTVVSTWLSQSSTEIYSIN